MFIIDTIIDVPVGDFSNQTYQFATTDPEGAIYKKLNRPLKENESYAFVSEAPNGSIELVLSDFTFANTFGGYVHTGSGTPSVIAEPYKFVVDGMYNASASTPRDRRVGSLILPPNVDLSQMELTRSGSSGSIHSILMITVDDNDPLLLADSMDLGAFHERTGINDIPLLLNYGKLDPTGETGSRLDIRNLNSFVHEAVTRSGDGTVYVNFEKFKNFSVYKEVILRFQTVDGNSNLQDAQTVLYPGGTPSDTVNRSVYTGDSRRNRYDCVGKELSSQPVVSDHTNKSYVLSHRSSALFQFQNSTFGFEDATDNDYDDFYGTQTNPEFFIGDESGVVVERKNFGAINDHSFAIGKNVLAAGQQSFAQGSYTMARSNDSVALGRWNVGNPYNIFEVGVGSGGKDAKNAFEISQDGKSIRTSLLEINDDPKSLVTKEYVDGVLAAPAASGGAAQTFSLNFSNNSSMSAGTYLFPNGIGSGSPTSSNATISVPYDCKIVATSCSMTGGASTNGITIDVQQVPQYTSTQDFSGGGVSETTPEISVTAGQQISVKVANWANELSVILYLERI